MHVVLPALSRRSHVSHRAQHLPCRAMSFASRVRARENLVGTLVTFDCPAVVELLAGVGYDWLFIDTEHAPLTACLPNILRAAKPCPCLVRIPALTEAAIKFALDLGADGIIVPNVNTEQQARDVVKWAKYSPMGVRGVGGGLRAQAYGEKMADYMKNANEDTLIVVQVSCQIMEALVVQHNIVLKNHDILVIGCSCRSAVQLYSRCNLQVLSKSCP